MNLCLKFSAAKTEQQLLEAVGSSHFGLKLF